MIERKESQNTTLFSNYYDGKKVSDKANQFLEFVHSVRI